MATIRSMAREIRLANPDVPLLLAEKWLINRYQFACRQWMWSFKLKQGQFDVPDVYSDGTVTLTDDDATVTGSGTTFTAVMAGRQFKANGYVYNFQTYTSGTEFELDRTWENATEAGVTYSIVGAYLTPETYNSSAYDDFMAFWQIVDPIQQRILKESLTQSDLNRMDPTRSTTGNPTHIVPHHIDSSGKMVYELYPHPTEQRTYEFIYERRMDPLTGASTPPRPMEADLLIAGAMADLSRWPGTIERPNPFAGQNSQANWQSYEREWQDKLNRAILEDQTRALNNFAQKYPRVSRVPGGTDFFRSHDF